MIYNDLSNDMKTVKVFIERADDGTYSAYMDDVMQLPYGLNGVGNSVQEAIADWNKCYEEMREFFASRGEAFAEAQFTFAKTTAKIQAALHAFGKELSQLQLV